MWWVEVIGLLAASITTLCWLPQALHTIRTKDTKGISLVSYGAFACGVTLWLIYGLLIGDLPIIVANTVTVILVLAIIALKLRYHR